MAKSFEATAKKAKTLAVRIRCPADLRCLSHLTLKSFHSLFVVPNSVY